ncbi:MAG TPA: carbamoyl-phosphate synthase large subunit, partial [Tistrella mobilis]|nr:carbamoyl-phosphate synthase large subunit [Tistrella mobilis]
GIEFDYCCVHAAFAMKELGYESIMVNCNPETVSTDYDTSDRLYFEPLTFEDVMAIVREENPDGVIVQFGGQTPLKLAVPLAKAGVPILGTSADAIDRAEDRERFDAILEKLGLSRPQGGIAKGMSDAIEVAERIGYPVVVRPSYVLGGRAMEIVDSEAQLDDYIATAVNVSGDSPVLVDQYLRDAIECDVDVVADGTEVRIAGVMQHIEEAGVHSGDSACTLPPYSLDDEIIAEIRRQTEALALKLGVVGLMNVQFAVKDREIYILEVNPRASRTVPFVAKAVGRPIAKIAARIMAGEKLGAFDLAERKVDHIAIKEAVFPFARFPGVDILLGPEMKSTGEVMGLDTDFGRSFAKAQLAAGVRLPTSGRVFVSVRDDDKDAMVEIARGLKAQGFEIVATRGTARVLADAGIQVELVKKAHEGRPNIIDQIKDRRIDMVFNTTAGSQAISDSYSLRRETLMNKVPYFTTVAGCRATVQAIAAIRAGTLEVRSLQSYSA